MSEVFFPEGRKITIAGKDVTVRPFVLRNRILAIRLLADAAMEVQKGNPGITKEQLLADPDLQATVLNVLVNSAGERLVDLYVLATGEDRKWLQDHVLIKDEIALFSAIWEENDIPFLIGQVKSLIQGLKTQGKI